MSDVLNIYKQSEFALAAYASLSAGITGDAYISALADGGKNLSQNEAENFAAANAVVAQYNDTATEGGLGTGLSVTVFRNNASNQLTVAIRGTELGDSRDLSTDATMVTAGVAYDQLVALYNWWARESAAPGTQVQQYRLTATPQSSNAVQVGTLWLEASGTVNAVGGHLAMTFSTLFAASTTQAIVFNAPGLKNISMKPSFCLEAANAQLLEEAA